MQGTIVELRKQMGLELGPPHVDELSEAHIEELATLDLVQLSELKTSEESPEEEVRRRS
jgi:hypothetical protein